MRAVGWNSVVVALVALVCTCHATLPSSLALSYLYGGSVEVNWVFGPLSAPSVGATSVAQCPESLVQVGCVAVGSADNTTALAAADFYGLSVSPLMLRACTARVKAGSAASLRAVVACALPVAPLQVAVDDVSHVVVQASRRAACAESHRLLLCYCGSLTGSCAERGASWNSTSLDVCEAAVRTVGGTDDTLAVALCVRVTDCLTAVCARNANCTASSARGHNCTCASGYTGNGTRSCELDASESAAKSSSSSTTFLLDTSAPVPMIIGWSCILICLAIAIALAWRASRVEKRNRLERTRRRELKLAAHHSRKSLSLFGRANPTGARVGPIANNNARTQPIAQSGW